MHKTSYRDISYFNTYSSITFELYRGSNVIYNTSTDRDGVYLELFKNKDKIYLTSKLWLIYNPAQKLECSICEYNSAKILVDNRYKYTINDYIK